MSTYTTPCKKDEDWSTKWGPSGQTARMKAAQDCFDRGYYDVSVEGCGDWRFKANCSNQVPEGWSKPYSDETAKEEGFTTRDAAMVADCQRRGYGAIVNPGPENIRWKGDTIWPNSYYSMKCISQPADQTECCLENNSQNTEVKTIRDTTCDSTYRGHGSLGCQNVMSQQCTIDNFTGDTRKFNACKNYIEADPSSSQSRQTVQSLTRSYLTKYSPAEIRSENIVNFQDGSNVPEYLMDRCNASGACEAVLTEKCGNYNMNEISSRLYQLKRDLNTLEPGEYFIEYMSDDRPVTMIKPDDNGKDIYFAPVQLNGQSGYVMYSNPFGKTAVTSSQPSFNLWKNPSNTNVTVTLKDKSINALRRKQIKDEIEGLLMTLKWCGCHFPQSQYMDALEGKIECDIKCKTSGVQRFLDNQKQTCRDTICVVDVANLAIRGSSIGDFNIAQTCGTDSNPAQCYVNFEGVGISDSELANFYLTNQQCANSTLPSNSTHSSNTTQSTMTLSSAIETKKLTVFLRDYEGLIPGHSLLLFLTLVLVSGLLLSIGTMFISPLIGIPLILITFGFVTVYMIAIRYQPQKLLII